LYPLGASQNLYIIMHTFLVSLMRQFIGSRELVHPIITHFATSFISLKSLLTCMLEVKIIFLLDEWHALSFSSKLEGQVIFGRVSYQESVWLGVEEVCAISEPSVKVLCLVDGDKIVIGYLYEAIDTIEEAIHSYYEYKGDGGYEK
jgi:hypothetical protein